MFKQIEMKFKEFVKLKRKNSGPYIVEYEFSKRMKWNWKAEKRGKNVRVKVPYCLAEENKETLDNFFNPWINLSFRKNLSTADREEKRRIEEQVYDVIREKSKHLPVKKSELSKYSPQGKNWNLQELFEELNEEYFNNELEVVLTWSSRIGGLSFHSKRHRSNGDAFNLISVSQGYDFENCPRYAVKGVLYHECLHVLIPTEMVNGRRVVHGREFKRREKLYTFYAEWIKWHKEVLPGNVHLLKQMAKRKPYKP